MILYQTHKHPKRQEDHLRKNSLRLQTTQDGKGTSQVDRRRRETRLLWRRRHFHRRHHNIQNPDQQHTFHRGRRHDDDGHKKTIIYVLHYHGLNT
jgi:hypothetical protein